MTAVFETGHLHLYISKTSLHLKAMNHSLLSSIFLVLIIVLTITVTSTTTSNVAYAIETGYEYLPTNISEWIIPHYTGYWNKLLWQIKLAGKRRLSTEYTMLSILEYLCINSLHTPVSKYHIINKIPGIRQQRQDRVSAIMGTLETNGFINSIRTSSNSTFYQITSKGLEVYSKWVKDFLEFVRSADIWIDNSSSIAEQKYQLQY